jgi:hypothetical protein
LRSSTTSITSLPLVAGEGWKHDRFDGETQHVQRVDTQAEQPGASIEPRFDRRQTLVPDS